MARQRLGQHFLGDPAWREQIARAIRVSPHSLAPSAKSHSKEYCWIEIGAGHGEMTSHLAATGAPVYAVEVDPALARQLQNLANQFPNLKIVSGDVLKADLAKLADGRRIRIYGNLPYYITSPILHHVFGFADVIDEMNMVIQTEVAERLTAEPDSKDYGYLSVATQVYARLEFVFRIPRGAFLPPPDVSSALVTLRFPSESVDLDSEDKEEFLEFVKACFSQKRKTLVNNLKSKADRDQVQRALGEIKFRPDARAEQLSVKDFVAVYRRVWSRAKHRGVRQSAVPTKMA
jgi:16S rRNA (adenine1518-N6/adenine1519-N6)-dimethyltransferase